MGFIKKWNSPTKLKKSEVKSLDVHQVPGFKIEMQIANTTSGKFVKVAFLVDSGFSDQPLAIPQQLADELGIKITSKSSAIGIDGKESEMGLGTCAIINGQTTLADVPVAVGSPIPIIGYPLLQKMVFYTKSGEIVFADFDGSVQGASQAESPIKV